MLWSGAFSQLTNSKVEANFADARTYTYKEKPSITPIISVSTYRSPSITRGSGQQRCRRVCRRSGHLWQHGDHRSWLGAFHPLLSPKLHRCQSGRPVKQKQIIGKTGETGLAVGDHLHFGVYLNGLAVLPVEWWDEKWINDNVQPKLDGSSGENIEQAKGTPPRKVARKRKR